MSEFKHTDKELLFTDNIRQDLINRVKHNKKTVEKLAMKYGIENKNLVKELTELAIVRIARSIAHNNKLTDKEKYYQIVDLYNNQVNLSHRTSESILLQQYSTPAPIGYLAGLYVLGKNTENKQYLEPSAGNGLLTIALKTKSVFVNELDDVRNANLKTQGFAKVYRFDATRNIATENDFYRLFDGIITNPPFGSLEKEVNYGEGSDNFPIKTLDHLMCLRALDCMKDNGRTAMIIGGHTKWDERGRIQAGKNRIFFNYLYRYYNVDDVINIDGHKLYSRQGTAFNVRFILIDGRKYKPEGVAPLRQKHDTEVHSFEELWERVMLSMDFKEEKTDKNTNLKLMLAKAKHELINFQNEEEK